MKLSLTSSPADTKENGTKNNIGSSAARKPTARNLIAFSSMIMILFCIIVAYQAAKAYEEAVDIGKAASERLSRSFGDHVELTLAAVDVTLRRAVERQYFNTLFGEKLPKDMENNFSLWVNETNRISGLYKINSNGRIAFWATKTGQEKVFDESKDLENAEFFLKAKESSSDYPYIGVVKADSGAVSRDILTLSRQVNNIDGSFGGVIVATVDPSYFIDFFKSIETGSMSYTFIAEKDGNLLVSGPALDAVNERLVKVISEENSKGNNHKSLTEMISIEDTIKIYSYVSMRNLPILAGVIIDEKDFLNDWSTDRVKDIGFLAIFAIFGSVLSFFALTMAKQIKRVEESEAAAVLASQAKSEFLANMSHELRTPLNAIIGFSEMMDSGYFGNMNPKQKERVHDINLCGNHLLQLINDILEFSKGEAGKLELVEEEVEIGEIVGECIRIMNEKAKVHGINIESGVSVDLPMLRGDKRKIRQILLNLTSNAIKFTPKNGSVRLKALYDEHKQLIISVEDTGIGIPEADIPKALSVFGQVHRNMSHEGTGLGLPLCKMFAELHGGELTLESKVGVGTKVTIRFPAERTMPHKEAKAA